MSRGLERLIGTKAEISAADELIQQARAPAAAYGCLGSTGVHFVSDDRDECVQESRRDGSLVVDLIVRPFALAKLSRTVSDELGATCNAP